MNVFNELWKNIQQHFNAFRPDAFSIKNKGSWLNYLFIFIGIAGALFFLLGNLFVTDKIENKHTKTGEYYKLDMSNKVKIDQWLWNKNTDTLDIILEYKSVDNNRINENVTYSYIARANDNASKKLDIKTVAKSNNKVALRVQEVGKGFEVLGLEIYSNSSESEKQKVGSLLANEKKVSITNSNNLKNNEEYQLEFIKNDQQDVAKSIKKIEGKIKKYNQEIDRKEVEASQLDDEKEYQTTSERNNTDSKISSIHDEIREITLNIDREKEKLEEEKEAKKLLESKYKDMKEFTE